MIFSSLNAWKEARGHRRWLKALNIPNHLATINQVYQDTSGHILSQEARLAHPDLALTYGEIELESFLALLSLTQPNRDTIFIDLGCGVGKTLMACHKVYHVATCVGIEILNPLVEVARQKQRELDIPDEKMTFIAQDILNATWPSTSTLYLNVATFVPQVWQDIKHKIQENPPQTMITLCKPLELVDFDTQETKVLTSWGIVPAYIQKYNPMNFKSI